MPARSRQLGPSIAADDTVFTEVVRQLLASAEERGIYTLGLDPVDMPMLYAAQEGMALRAHEALVMPDGEVVPVMTDPLVFVDGWWKDLGFTPGDLARMTKILDLNVERLAHYTSRKRGPRRKRHEYDDIDVLRLKMAIACARIVAPVDLEYNRRGKMSWRQFRALRPLRAWLGYSGCLLAPLGLAGVVLAVVLLALGNDWGRWAIGGLVLGVVGALALLFSFGSYLAGAEAVMAAAEGQLDPVVPPAEYPEMLRVRLRRSERMLAAPIQAVLALDDDVWYRLYYADLPFDGYHEGVVLSLEPVTPPVRGA